MPGVPAPCLTVRTGAGVQLIQAAQFFTTFFVVIWDFNHVIVHTKKDQLFHADLDGIIVAQAIWTIWTRSKKVQKKSGRQIADRFLLCNYWPFSGRLRHIYVLTIIYALHREIGQTCHILPASECPSHFSLPKNRISVFRAL